MMLLSLLRVLYCSKNRLGYGCSSLSLAACRVSIRLCHVIRINLTDELRLLLLGLEDWHLLLSSGGVGSLEYLLSWRRLDVLVTLVVVVVMSNNLLLLLVVLLLLADIIHCSKYRLWHSTTQSPTIIGI